MSLTNMSLDNTSHPGRSRPDELVPSRYGCAFCVDMHVKEATLHGERALRLHHVAVWHESPLFSPRERAALA